MKNSNKKFGEKIKVSKKHSKAFKVYKKLMDTARVGISLHTEEYKSNVNKLFKVISELYPEVQEYNIKYDHANSEITILERKINK